MLSRQHHTLSQLLLFKGCLSEEEIRTELLFENEQDDELDIESLINSINRWNESNHTCLHIEEYKFIDHKTYYGWRPTVTDDPISLKSNSIFGAKQFNFWKILLNIAITNSGLFSLQSAFSLNRAAMSGINNILTRSEIMSLFEYLAGKRYIVCLNDIALDTDDVKSLEIDEDDEENTNYVLGPNAFIDTKIHCDSKTEHCSNECCLCSEFCMMRGFKCSNGNCVSVMHSTCITDYFRGGSFKCPVCQNNVDINNVDQVSEYVQILSQPSNAIKIINDLKQLSNQNDMTQDD
eukprot:13444_1